MSSDQKRERIAIVVEDSSDVTFGHIEAHNVDQLMRTSNSKRVSVGTAKLVRGKFIRLWHEKPIGILALGLASSTVIAIASSYAFG